MLNKLAAAISVFYLALTWSSDAFAQQGAALAVQFYEQLLMNDLDFDEVREKCSALSRKEKKAFLNHWKTNTDPTDEALNIYKTCASAKPHKAELKKKRKQAWDAAISFKGLTQDGKKLAKILLEKLRLGELKMKQALKEFRNLSRLEQSRFLDAWKLEAPAEGKGLQLYLDASSVYEKDPHLSDSAVIKARKRNIRKRAKRNNDGKVSENEIYLKYRRSPGKAWALSFFLTGGSGNFYAGNIGMGIGVAIGQIVSVAMMTLGSQRSSNADIYWAGVISFGALWFTDWISAMASAKRHNVRLERSLGLRSEIFLDESLVAPRSAQIAFQF